MAAIGQLDLCAEVLVNRPDNTTANLETHRKTLQGYVRGFSADEFYDRYTYFFHDTASLFVPDVYFGTSWRSACSTGAATLGALLWLFGNAATQGQILAHRWGRLSDVPPQHQIMVAALHAVESGLRSNAWLREAASWPLFAIMAMLTERLGLKPRKPAAAAAANNGALEKATATGSLPIFGPPGDWTRPLPSAEMSVETTKTVLALWDDWLASGAWDLPEALRRVAGLFMNEALDPCLPTSAAVATALGGLNSAAVMIQDCITVEGVRSLLARQWASIWRGLDRLSSFRAIDVIVDKDFPEKAFRMHLLPPHIHGSQRSYASFRFLADRIRVKGSPHCNPTFKEIALHLLKADRARGGTMATTPLVIADVGAHLADCCLWALGRLESDEAPTMCHAFERDEDAVAAIRRTIDRNGLQDRLKLHSVSIEGASAEHCGEEGSWGNSSASSLDCVFVGWPQVDLLKVHVDGGRELWVLEGLRRTLAQGNVRVCLVRSTVLQPQTVRAFLIDHRLPYIFGTADGGKNTLLLHDSLAFLQQKLPPPRYSWG
eukprot:TRINITY_DN101590_c0_g1_i1.p1 TRINITY_DN101590_c0_g1~~TRINITY_DN101590_c0_g1_i1.p1  ORF type:complete len:547 (-),score=106.93 TRINITY_DN101590_c0_g1_i1:443-2083(-)